MEEVGFKVICVVTDNYTINKKAMSQFMDPPKILIVYKHPSSDIRPLFFATDSVHLIKCVRNNWLNQNDDDQSFQYPDFGNISGWNGNVITASFKALKKLHYIENNSLIKHGYGFSLKA